MKVLVMEMNGHEAFAAMVMAGLAILAWML